MSILCICYTYLFFLCKSCIGIKTLLANICFFPAVNGDQIHPFSFFWDAFKTIYFHIVTNSIPVLLEDVCF